MAILIDTPRWPAHGTLFAHLVSDESLTELHAFAARTGLPPGAFDADHYDVPAHRHADLIALGASHVSGRELIRRLRRSGLRVPGRDRPGALRRTLLGRWEHLPTLRPELTALTLETANALLHRWSEPHRRYHDLRHLREVLAALDLLTAPDPPPAPVVLAAWFHDAVYTGAAEADEVASADLAPDLLAGLSPSVIAETRRLIVLTITHDPAPGDAHGALLCDADLSVLGRDEAGYQRYLTDIRAEYAHLSEQTFRTGRIAVVRRLLNTDPLFHTARGRERWLARARTNLESELRTLR